MANVTKYVSDFPELVAEWHPTKNGDSKPQDFKSGSGKKVWWRCSLKHEWEAYVYNRTKGNGCPYCTGRLATRENSLQVLMPTLAEEYDDKNNVLAPDEIKPRSGKKVWWHCKNGHSWQATVASRAGGSGCPYCVGKKASKSYNLAVICPEIASEWHPTKNSLTAFEVTPKSNKRVWWICKSGHEYEATVNNRVKPTGCPVCSRSVASKHYNLNTEYPLIAAEWHSTKNEKKATEFLPASNKRVWWQCSEGHEWEVSINSRTNQQTGCPYCSGLYASEEYNLAVKYPNLLNEWHPTKNEFLPTNVTPRSDKKAWWICSKGHEWQAVIGSRATGIGCPKCTSQTSKNELRILTELMTVFSVIKSRTKIDGVEVDIYIPEINTAIEYDGSYWHKNKDDKDREKNRIVDANKIKLLRVREAPLKKIKSSDIIVPAGKDVSKKVINRILSEILNDPDRINAYVSNRKFFNHELFRTYLDNFPSPLPQHSLSKTNPNLSNEWHPTKNDPLTPLNFSPNATYKAWWQCEKGHEWQVSIHQRNGKKTGCPYCSGRRALEDNNLGITRPDLVRLLHPSRNKNFDLNQVKAGSQKKVWWLCDRGHEWEATIKNMARPRQSNGCPYCAGKKLNHENSLAAIKPELLEEWHPNLNELSPDNVTAGSGKKVWWICKVGHEWQATVYSRAKGAGCRKCNIKQKTDK